MHTPLAARCPLLRQVFFSHLLCVFSMIMSGWMDRWVDGWMDEQREAGNIRGNMSLKRFVRV